jgi:hypothetical protein
MKKIKSLSIFATRITGIIFCVATLSKFDNLIPQSGYQLSLYMMCISLIIIDNLSRRNHKKSPIKTPSSDPKSKWYNLLINLSVLSFIIFAIFVIAAGVYVGKHFL